MSAAPVLREEDLGFLRRLVRERSAIALDASKDYLLEARLLPVADREGLGGLAGLVASLRARPGGPLTKQVVEALTTNETSFFRDVAPFECLKKAVLPALMAHRPSGRLDVWCGASSSGQEPYSVLFSLEEAGHPGLEPRLLATDLHSAMVERTREGIYSQLEVNRGLPARMLVKHFDRQGTRWQVKAVLRARVEARELNLIDPWPSMPRMDIVFLRNVLIYFEVPQKQAILAKIRSVLAPDGYLFLGGAETTLGVDDGFVRFDYANAGCYRLRAAGEVP